EDAIDRFAKQNPSHAWEAWPEQEYIKGAATSMWYTTGPALESALAKRRVAERAFRASLANQPKPLERYHQAEKQLAQSLKDLNAVFAAYWYLESEMAFDSQLFKYARNLVRLAEESAKPDAERLLEYTENRITPLKHRLFAQIEIGQNLEQVKL